MLISPNHEHPYFYKIKHSLTPQYLLTLFHPQEGISSAPQLETNCTLCVGGPIDFEIVFTQMQSKVGTT